MTIDEMKNNSPDGKFMTTLKIGPKGQIVIPKEVRDMFGINCGDMVVFLADIDRGMAIQKISVLEKMLQNGFNANE